MRTKDQILLGLKEPGVIAVLRARSPAQIIPLGEALLAGGIGAIEVTLTTPDALRAIADARLHFGTRALIGVGTVLDADTCQEAIDAGAEFVVSPILRPEIAKKAAEQDRPVMLGAYTPTEAQLAYEAGSDFVKIFPSDTLGPAYVRAIRAPLPHLQIIPTGIAKAGDVSEFIRAGCPAVGVGSLLVSKHTLELEDWETVTERAHELVRIVHMARAD